MDSPSSPAAREPGSRPSEDSAEAVVWLDAAGAVTGWSPGAEALLGWNSGEALGRPLADLAVAPEARAAHASALVRHLASAGAGLAWRLNFPGTRRDGRRFVAEIGVAGEGEGFRAALRDIDLHGPLSEELQRHALFFLRLPDLFCVLGSDGYFRQFNLAWEEKLGYTPDELLSRPFFELVHPQDLKTVLAATRSLGEGGDPVSLELRLVGKEATRTVLWHASSFRAGDLIYVLARDITEATGIDRLKREFLSVVNHELRTPLTSIGGALGLLGGGALGELSAGVREMVELAQRNTQRLVHVINQMLDIDQIEFGGVPFDFRPCRILPALRDAIEAIRPVGERAGLQYVLADGGLDLEVRAEPTRLLQVLGILLSNAVRYSPKGGTVTVQVARRDDTFVRIAVEDHGPGIEAEMRRKLFRKFAQADGSDRRVPGGAGLGLSLAKTIVERHGGEIGFTSDPGAGTSFHFDLPEWKPPARTDAGAAIEAVKRRILVLHEDPEVASLTAGCLQLTGFAAEVSADADQARDRLATDSFSAIVLSFDPTHLGTLRHAIGLAVLAEERRVSLIVATPDLTAARRLLGEDLGVVEWLETPLSPARLVGAVERAVKHVPHGRRRILHVENDRDVARVVMAMIGDVADVSHAVSIESARQRLRRDRFDLLILDLVLPDGNGIELLSELRGDRQIPVVIFSVVDPGTVPGVAAVLVKTRASHRDLVEQVRKLLDL